MKRASPSKSLNEVARNKFDRVPAKKTSTRASKKASKKARTSSSGGRAMNLQQLREHVRKTQGDVARKAAVTQPQLSRIEARRDHLVSTVRKYVRALGGDIRVVAEIGDERIVLLDV